MLFTLASNAGLFIGVLVVKNGFSSIYSAMSAPFMHMSTHLDVCLPEVDEEQPDPVVVLDVVQENELDCAPVSQGPVAAATHLPWV